VRAEYDIFAEGQSADDRFGSLAERLLSLRSIDKRDSDADLSLGHDQHVDRVAIDNTCYASAESHVLQAKRVGDGRERILAKNAKSTGENEQGDESGKRGTASSKESSVDTYRFRFSSFGCLAVHITPCFLFQLVQSQPAHLALNGWEESPGLVSVLKRPEPPSTPRLGDGYLIEFFAFDRYRMQARTTFAGHRSAMVRRWSQTYQFN